MGDCELACPDFSGRPVDLDLGDNRGARPAALHIGDAAPGDLVAGLIPARRRPRLPARLLGRSLHHSLVARVLDVAQAELDRIDAQRRCHFVDEGFAAEVDHGRIAHVRGPQR